MSQRSSTQREEAPAVPVGPLEAADSRTTGRTILKNSAFLIAADVLRRAFSLVTVLIVARSLGVEGFGQYSFVLSFVGLFGGFATFGLDTVLIKDVARDPRRTRPQFSATLLLKLATSSLTALAMMLTISLFDYAVPTTRAVYIMALASVFFALTETATAVCTATQKMEYGSILSVARGILLIVLIPVFLLFSVGLTSLFLAQLTAAVLLFSLSVMVVTSRVSPISFPVDRQLLGGVLRSALPFVLIGGIYMIGYRVDVLMLSRMAGDAAVGSYGAAYTPIELVVSISQLLTAALFPALSQAFGASLTAFRVIVARSMKIFLALSLPMSVGIFLLAPQILGTMFSEEFDVGTGTLQILGAAVWIFFLQIIVGWLLTAADRLRTLVTINVVTLILNLASNFVLIPRYGAAGAAASQVICSAVALSVLVTVAHSAGVLSLAGLRPLRMLFAVGVMGVVTYALREMNVFVVVAAAALLYLALLRATRTVDPEELAELRGMFRGTLRSQPPEPQRG